MLVRTLANQFVRDLQVSWQKTAVLCALFFVGLYFWIPPLVRAISGPGSSTAATKATDANGPGPAPAIPTVTRTEPETRTLSTWQQADQVQATDPLVLSAELAAIRTDPFRVDETQFSPPVLFAEERDEPPAQPQAVTNTSPAESVVLRSTIVGVSRRAAFINQKLYFEGSEVQVNGEPWRLIEIHPRKVVLRKGDVAMELTIAAQDPAASAQ